MIDVKNIDTTSKGFTIVELLIVIVVIGILAAITIVSFSGIQARARVASMVSDLDNSSKQLKIDQVTSGNYPTTVAAANGGQGLKASSGTTYRYSVNNSTNPQTFCLSAENNSVFYSITDSGTPTAGSCVNVALGASAPSSLLTDGSTAYTPYYDTGSGLQSVTVDLGTVYDISSIKVWHYWGDACTYYATKTEVSTDNTNWSTIYDSATSGTYQETSVGKTFSFPVRQVRYIRDWLNGSTANVGDHWVEIQAF